MQVGPWIDVDDCELCGADSFPPGRLERAILAASELLFSSTCKQFTGILQDSIRPSMAASGAFGGFTRDFPILADGSRWVPFGLGELPGLVFGCGCGSFEFTGCRLHSAVYLPGVPVIEVTSVKVDGEEITDWTLVDNRAVWRNEGAWFPCCADPTIPLTDDGSFGIDYTYGVLPNAAGLLACEVLACELARSWGGDCDDCRLPRRLTSIVREGMSVSILDPFQFLDQGRFGLWETDVFVSQFDCKAGAERPASVLSASTWARNPHRVG